MEMLKKNYEFNKVLKYGKGYYGQFYSVILIKNNKNKNRLGIAISKKIAGSVERNRLKRLIRENYRKIEEEINPKNDIIVLINKKYSKNTKQIDFTATKQDLFKIFTNANLVNIKEM
jgi:ribonuclease P protein component